MGATKWEDPTMKPGSWVDCRISDGYHQVLQYLYKKRRLNKIINYLGEKIREEPEVKAVFKMHGQRLNTVDHEFGLNFVVVNRKKETGPDDYTM